MTDFSKIEKALKNNGFEVHVFQTGKEAADYLNGELDGTSIGFGGSKTLEELGLYESLSAHNDIAWHWRTDSAEEARRSAQAADVYMCSANAAAETGELIFVDATGNRVSSLLWGHKKVILIIGANKIAPDYDAAVARCRNVACTTRAADFTENTPCVKAGKVGEHCFDCKSADRVCKAMVTLWRAMNGSEYEVILIDEELGY